MGIDGAPRRFTQDLGGSGEQCWVEATVHRGGVCFVEITTNPNYGGPAGMGSRTHAQVLAGDVPPGLPPSFVEELQAYVRTLPPDDGPDAWDARGLPLLVVAAAKGDRAEVARLLDAGATIDALGLEPTYGPALAVAAMRGHRDVVADLIARGALPATTKAALEALLAAVRSIGDANDAADHGAHESSDAIYASAPARARDAWALAPSALARLLPDLAQELSTGAFDTSRWFTFAQRIERLLVTT